MMKGKKKGTGPLSRGITNPTTIEEAIAAVENRKHDRISSTELKRQAKAIKQRGDQVIEDGRELMRQRDDIPTDAYVRMSSELHRASSALRRFAETMAKTDFALGEEPDDDE
jgi:hypothetical protein